jgi:acetyltransferase-like isoleucine patch superfamily enzyme
MLYKVLKLLIARLGNILSQCATFVVFKLNNVKHRDFVANGVPYINVSLNNATLTIGRNFVINSGYANPIGRQQRSLLVVGPGAELSILDNVGISNTAIICHHRILIGNNVRIGGNVVIYDSDFHSLDYKDRTKIPEDFKNVTKKTVVIEDNVFIGAHSTILKGVRIGAGSIIGAGSVVTKNVSANEIWAGNPAKFLKKMDNLYS